MDLSKYPLEKIFFFIAGVMPGFVALLIFEVARPGAFQWFFTMGFLGYKSKLGLAILVAFVVGNSITAFLAGIIGGIGGGVGGWKASRDPYVPPHTYEIAPWRDPRWRIALTSRLGPKAPSDTRLLTRGTVEFRRNMIGQLPETDRPLALSRLREEEMNTQADDSAWALWYGHFHRIILLEEGKRDVTTNFRNGLYFNFQACGVYVLLSSLWVRGVRHWWIILPCALWALMLLAREYTDYNRWGDQWSSLSGQIRYLSEGEGDSYTP